MAENAGDNSASKDSTIKLENLVELSSTTLNNIFSKQDFIINRLEAINERIDNSNSEIREFLKVLSKKLMLNDTQKELFKNEYDTMLESMYGK